MPLLGTENQAWRQFLSTIQFPWLRHEPRRQIQGVNMSAVVGTIHPALLRRSHRQDACFLAPGSRNAWRMWSFSLWRHRPHWLFPHGRVCHLAFKGGTARKPRTLIMCELYYFTFKFIFILLFLFLPNISLTNVLWYSILLHHSTYYIFSRWSHTTWIIIKRIKKGLLWVVYCWTKSEVVDYSLMLRSSLLNIG